MDLKFFTVKDRYITYLKKIDHRVPNNYSEGKPFIGILLSVNGFDYVAPLTSAKPKHEKIKNSNPTSFKIHDGTLDGDLLAVVQVNNMIPVKKDNITKFHVEAQGIEYQFLLFKELNYIRTHRDSLLKKATKLYKMVTVSCIPNFVGISCDFKKLEVACKAYK